MNSGIELLSPFRWKVWVVRFSSRLLSLMHFEQVFQVLLLDSENTGKDTGSLRDARKLVITDEQFQTFLDMHKDQSSLVPENNVSMKDSYLNLDERMWYATSPFHLESSFDALTAF
jgi:radical S-adenosyl methionine domain-containing protein 2